jgi:hypothetical protein
MLSMKNILLLVVSVILFSCSNSELPESGENNANSQSMPTIMVFPSDALLLNMGFLREIHNQGTTSYQRDYQQAFIKNPNVKFAIASLQEEFAKNGFRLEDMEQQLKQITNNNAMDEANGIARDIKTELLNTVRPDYIIELDYNSTINARSRNGNSKMTFTIRCLDVYTNKAIASVTKSGVDMSGDADMASKIKEIIGESMTDFKSQITTHFNDLNKNGVEITLRVAANATSGIEMDDDCGDEEIGEKIDVWLKQNTINQAFKMVKNTDVEVSYTNVRIKAREDNGMKYTAYDFAKDLKKGLKKGCGLDVSNSTQSLGDALLIIEGERK